jgi:diguanylate cyclase (GGDEF)-like protein
VVAAALGAFVVPGAWALGLTAAAGVGVGLLLSSPLSPSGSSSAAPDARPDPATGAELDEREVLARALELARLSTDAHEAALWRMSPDRSSASLEAWAALPGYAPESRAVFLEGHPFGWAILEQVHVRLERGKRPLPTTWAAEMLLMPVEGPEGLLALAYSGGVPPGAEQSALVASAHLAALVSLLRVGRDARRTEERVQTLFEAVRVLPGELDLDRFAEELTESVCRSTDAAGAAVLLWDNEAGRGEVLALVGEAPGLVGRGSTLSEGESRAALAAKHTVALSYDDLPRERDRLPLLREGERWGAAPRSAAVMPLVADGRALGVVVAWHPEPGRFGAGELEFLRLLCAVAPLPLRSARRYEALDRRASTDPLTELPNRSLFETRFAATASHFERYARPFSVVMLDIDHFKRFNDTWGHEAGDRVLQHVAELLRSTVREVDLPARLGGEEFVLLLPETLLMPAVEVAERVRRAIQGRPLTWNGRPLQVTVSLGVASCPESLENPADLLAAADAALYRAKAAGRNRTTAAPPGRRSGVHPQGPQSA